MNSIAMNKLLQLAMFASILIALCAPSRAQTCQNYKFSNHNTYSRCVDLPVLNSFLHWNYTASSYRLDLAFRHVGATASEWIAWAINPLGLRMVGSQALVAYQRPGGQFYAYASPINGYDTGLLEGRLSFSFSGLSGTFEGGEMTIFASLQLTSDMVTINQVWQNGPLKGGTPAIHAMSADHLASKGTLNLVTGATS
ncbi:cytochrome b561 and DOMON domain-containing protein At4g17280-like [Rhodamnia argentea]|uniref:Cytochrome b561 and DOMON domain-containing protein At4g17280-like n=1 Tax=Rhodamnia argentea TaxID=178133 RepID=A0A8B8PZP2_9MYRT|nr:cytochrome b561 and DOMON domain-containing protein At4g17280-like [Rhodamnia argentea]